MTHDLDLDAAPIVAWRAVVIDGVRNSMQLLDLAARRARQMAARILDQQERQNLIRQIETIERQLQLARDMAGRL
jgi:methionyl-tRNA formyltransferase